MADTYTGVTQQPISMLNEQGRNVDGYELRAVTVPSGVPIRVKLPAHQLTPEKAHEALAEAAAMHEHIAQL